MSVPAVPTSDPRWSRPTHTSWIDRYFLPRLRDERDLIFVHLSIQILFTHLPLALLLYTLPSWVVLVVAFPYVLLQTLRFLGPYTLMLHATCHRVLFKRAHSRWNLVIPWLLGPFFGHTPTSFFVHHMGMHHPENNLDEDLSTTLPYQRDSFVHWLHYWGMFFFRGLPDLVGYLRRTGRGKLERQLWLGELSWLLLIVGLLVVNPVATTVVFVVPLVLLRVLMMSGNFAQHAFVDVEDPANPYRNSTCLINCHYNHKCFNDGYHIVHHIKANLHWSEMAQWFDDHRSDFAEHDAIVFEGLRDNQTVFFLLMTGNYDRLAEHMVNWHGRTHAELVDLLKSRTRAAVA